MADAREERPAGRNLEVHRTTGPRPEGGSVYLAGGTTSDWQDRVIPVLRRIGVGCHDPRTLQRLGVEEVARRELEWLRSCRAVLCYYERENPLFGWALELGWARGAGRPVVLATDENDGDLCAGRDGQRYASRCRWARGMIEQVLAPALQDATELLVWGLRSGSV